VLPDLYRNRKLVHENESGPKSNNFCEISKLALRHAYLEAKLVQTCKQILLDPKMPASSLKLNMNAMSISSSRVGARTRNWSDESLSSGPLAGSVWSSQQDMKAIIPVSFSRADPVYDG
jgi:hypothetical protein